MNSGHPIEEYQSLRVPKYAWDYIDQLKSDYGALTLSNPSNGTSFLSIPTSTFAWSDLFALESAILRIDPPDNLRRVVWRWRARFRRIVGETAYQTYIESKPPDAATADVVEIRADLGSLASEVHYLYIMSPARERTRDTFLLWSFFGIASVIILISFLLAFNPNPHIPALAIVMFTGWVGGLFSVQERLSSLPDGDPLFRQLQLLGSRWSILLSPLTGAAFSLILYLCFAGGLVKGDLFPQIVTPTRPDPHGMPFNVFTNNSGPYLGIDWPKLVVWSFIAGFAERLIPNIINRLASSSSLGTEARNVVVK